MTGVSQTQNTPSSNVVYVPVGLSAFQRDLIEIVISMHYQSLRKELYNVDDKDHLVSQKSDIVVKNEPTDAAALTEKGFSHYPVFSNRQMIYLFDTHIRAIANHPCLLVDHYMPRQFLRMEPMQRIIDPSDKFRILQKILFILSRESITSSASSNSSSTPLNIVLIAHSIKELDLIEGLLLGQHFNLKRLSGTSLYDEKNIYTSHRDIPSYDNNSISSTSTNTSTTTNNLDGNRTNSSSNTASSSTSSSSSPSLKPSSSNTLNSNSNNSSFNTGMNRYTGYQKDDYDYSTKKHFKRRKITSSSDANDKNWLFLTTTKHLTHDETLLNQYDIDLIIGFDPLLNVNLPAIKNRYSHDNIPIIKLLVTNSPDHYILAKGLELETDIEKEFNDIKSSIDYFLKNRKKNINNDLKDHPSNSIDLKAIITNLLKNQNSPFNKMESLVIPTPENIHTDLEFLKPHINHLDSPITNNISKDDDDKDGSLFLPSSSTSFNLKNYQTELMQRTIHRLKVIERVFNENETTIIQKRLMETTRQNDIVSLKLDIGVNFKEFQDTDKLKMESEKKLERINTEEEKLESKYSTLQEKLRILENLIQDDEHGKNVIEYEKIVELKQLQLNALIQSNKEGATISDELRSEYQQNSNEAASKSLELTELKNVKDTMLRNKTGPLVSELNHQSMQAEEATLQQQLASLKNQTAFIRTYMRKMSAVNFRSKDDGKKPPHPRGKIKDQHQVSTSASTSSLVGDRNPHTVSRHRSTRSTSPNYT